MKVMSARAASIAQWPGAFHRYLEATALRQLPGGGSATALAAAIGVGLIEKVARLDAAVGTPEAATRLRRLRRHLERLASEDSRVFGETLRAMRAKRWGSMRLKARRATEIQLEVCRLAVQAEREAERLVRRGGGQLMADVGVAASLLRAATTGAALLCALNGPWLNDRRRARRYRAAASTLTQAAKHVDGRLHRQLRARVLRGG